MPKKSTISTLPSSVRSQLQHNRIVSPEWSIDDHVAFLSENGIEVSRSALHRWFQDNPVLAISAVDAVRAKTTALEAAVLIYKGDSKDELLSLAEQMLIWINTP